MYVLAHWGEVDGPVQFDGDLETNAGDVQWILDHWGAVQLPVIYVDASAPIGGDGRSWETAFRYLSDALEFTYSYPGQVGVVRIAGGTYRPDESDAVPNGTGDRWAFFRASRVSSVQGGYAGRQYAQPDAHDPERFPTILSGDLDEDDGPGFTNRDDNSRLIASAWSGASLSDLTLSGAEASDIHWSGTSGALAPGQSLHRRLTFIGNRAQRGAAVHGERTLRLEQCPIHRESRRAGRGGLGSCRGRGAHRQLRV